MRKDTGASVRIYNLAKGLASYGNDVHVVVPGQEAFYQSVDGIRVHSIRGFCPNMILKVLKKAIGVERATSLYFYDIAFITKTIRLIQKSDIVQMEQQTAGGLLIPFIQKVLRRPVVIDCHDIFQALRVRHTSALRRALETFLEKIAYRHADLILAVSEVEKKLLVSYCGHENCTYVIPNGVDTAAFTKSQDIANMLDKYGLKGSRLVIFVGNLEYLPNREAVQSLSSVIASRVVKEVKNAKFVVVGKTREKMNMPNLIFTGFVQHLSQLLSASDVAIAPLLHGSGSRLKILEYFSCGLPVVSTSVGAEGLRVTNGVNILIEDDLERFALRVVELLENPSLSRRLGVAARKFVEDEFDWREIARKLNILLHRVSFLGRKVRRPNAPVECC